MWKISRPLPNSRSICNYSLWFIHHPVRFISDDNFFFFLTLFILLFLYNSHSVFFIAVFLWLVNQWTVVSGRLCSNLKGAASPSRPETGRAKHRVLACPDPIRPECSCSWPHYREGLAPSSWFHDPPPSLYTLSLNSLQRETRRMVKAL